MYYLCSVLSGDASRAVSHLAITEANFAIAWDIISSRYENKRRLINVHLQTLFSLPTVLNETATILQALRDQANASIQALKNLGRPVDTWDDVLVYLVAQNLDKASRKAWELKLSGTTDFPTYAELDAFLKSRIHALEAILPNKTSGSIDTAKGKSAKIKSVAAHTTAPIKFACPICKKSHLLYQCMSFIAYAPARRREFIKAQRRCLNCLAANHLTRDCRSERRCRECARNHHTQLHASIAAEPANDGSSSSGTAVRSTSKSDVAAHAVSNTISAKTTVLLATARVRVYSASGRVAQVRALLDQGSAATLMSENLAQLLRLPRVKRITRVTGIDESHQYARHIAHIQVSPALSPEYSTNAIILKALTQYVPNRVQLTTQWSHLEDLPLADNAPMSSDPLDLIIGADLYGQMLLEGLRKGQRDEPIAQNTTLGWIISGSVIAYDSPSSVHTHHGAPLEMIDFNLRRFWEVEDLPHQTFLSPEEQESEDHFLQTHSRNQSGRYIVRLPFKTNPPPKLGESRSNALASLLRLERRLLKSPATATAYSEFLQEYTNLGHMSRIDNSELASVDRPYFIPHHAVYRADSLTTRLRVVFNASSKTTSETSLNDHLLVGPKLQNDLAAVILQWRQFQYVFTADIAKMYRQILVDARDTDYQRILWRASSSYPVEEYRLLTVTYGTAAAPFLAQRVLRQLAFDNGAQFPLALPVLLTQAYVDDCIFGADDQVLARQTRDQLIELLSNGGFQLRKWASNCPALLADIDPSDHGLAQTKDLLHDETLKVLGISWNPEQDAFQFRVRPAADPGTTKRSILSTIATFFDPLGWAASVMITAKITLQHLWSLRCDWDDQVPVDLSKEWIAFCDQLPRLREITIPRWTEYGSSALHCDLQGFADASTKAYAAAVYLRVVRLDGSVCISLLVAKAKVAPIKTISLPRLELCAAHLLARLLHFARSVLQMPSLACHCWTDSTIVLAWVRQPPSRWKTFVANRVAKIQALVSGGTWRHVPTHANPADCASRGLLPEDLLTHPLWWSGPSWLKQPPEFWPQPESLTGASPALEERVSLPVNAAHLEDPWDLPTRYSSWPKLLRITAFVTRFIRLLRGRIATAGQLHSLRNRKRRRRFCRSKFIRRESSGFEEFNPTHFQRSSRISQGQTPSQTPAPSPHSTRTSTTKDF